MYPKIKEPWTRCVSVRKCFRGNQSAELSYSPGKDFNLEVSNSSKKMRDTFLLNCVMRLWSADGRRSVSYTWIRQWMHIAQDMVFLGHNSEYKRNVKLEPVYSVSTTTVKASRTLKSCEDIFCQCVSTFCCSLAQIHSLVIAWKLSYLSLDVVALHSLVLAHSSTNYLSLALCIAMPYTYTIPELL